MNKSIWLYWVEVQKLVGCKVLQHKELEVLRASFYLGSVAQLVVATDWSSVRRKFESCSSHGKKIAWILKFVATKAHSLWKVRES